MYSVAGGGSDEFEGTLELGYQVGFPWSLGVGINFSYTTPNILLDDADLSIGGFNPLGSVITPNLFPGVSISADLGTAPASRKSPHSRWTLPAQRCRRRLERSWHGHPRRRRCAAASVRPPDLQGW